VIVGFSTPKIIEAVRREDKKIYNILVIEPDMGVFHQTIKRYNCLDIFKDESIDVITGVPMGELPIHIFKCFAKIDDVRGPRPMKCLQPEIICDPFVFPKNTEDPLAKEIIQIVQKQSQQVFTSMGCAADTYARWEQTTRNFDNLSDCYKIKELFDKVEGKNIIVLGGGPSLKGFIEEAKLRPELAKNSLVISCDATLPLLLKEGIRPHIVTRCERKLTTIFGSTKKEDTKDIFYAAYTWTPLIFIQ